jgi:CRP-like cAMP-binding protein
MRKVLYLLGILGDADIDWLVSNGDKRRFASGETLVTQGELADALFLVLDGNAEVQAGGKTVGQVGQGEVIGEVSLLDSRPPTATVTAEQDLTALAVPFTTLRSKMDSDTSFAAKFYKAIGMFLAARMRSVTLLATGARSEDVFEEDVELPDEIDPEVLEEVALAGARFRMLLERMNDR